MIHRILFYLLRFLLGLSYLQWNFAGGNSIKVKRPNIVFILADDLGFNDVSHLGSTQILTPNIDLLAAEGTILSRHYAQHLCSPSRSSLMTGKYPMHLGMQSMVIREGEPWGLGMEERLLPEYLKELGYSTHGVGKWHLGHHRVEYHPINRGFDTWLGFMGSDIDYFNYTTGYTYLFGGEMGRDMYRGVTPLDDITGLYTTDLFAQESERIVLESSISGKPFFLYLAPNAPHVATFWEPFQATPQYLLKPGIQDIQDLDRRKYAAMVQGLDITVGRVYAALAAKALLNNTIIVFTSDNGGQTPQIVIPGQPAGAASNWPFRGGKGMYFEGGVHTPAFIRFPMPPQKQIYDGLFHISDWLPTLYEAAGGNSSHLGKIDGVSHWSKLPSRSELVDIAPRKQLLINLDQKFNQAALISGSYKLLVGPDRLFPVGTKWYRPAGTTAERPLRSETPASVNCGPLGPVEGRPCDGSLDMKYCLFDLSTDPCETDNIANAQPAVITELLSLLDKYIAGLVASREEPVDKSADPKLHHGLWTSWLDEHN